MDTLQIMLIEEGEYSDVNYYFMQTSLKYKSTYLTNKSGNLFLTADSLITLSNFIRGSHHIGLRDINVKPAGYSKNIWTSLLLKLHYIL